MLKISAKVSEDFAKIQAIRPRGFKTALKAALKAAALYWHRTYAPRHFTWAAKRSYPAAYSSYKRRRKTPPLVITGTLRERILARITEADITGTSKGVRIRMRTGRPAKFPDNILLTMIFQRMRTRHESYRQAQRAVFRSTGYSAATMAKFQERITATNPQEVAVLMRVAKQSLLDWLNRSGNRRTRAVA